MACVRKRRGHWCLDYRDQQGMRHWETTKGNRKEAERLLAERVRQISKGTYQAPTERVSFEDLAQAYLKHVEASVRVTTFRDYDGVLRRHLMPWFQAILATWWVPGNRHPYRHPNSNSFTRNR